MERWVGLFERQVLAQELLAGSIDRLVSIQVHERPGPHEPEQREPSVRSEPEGGNGDGQGEEESEMDVDKEGKAKGKEKEI